MNVLKNFMAASVSLIVFKSAAIVVFLDSEFDLKFEATLYVAQLLRPSLLGLPF